MKDVLDEAERMVLLRQTLSALSFDDETIAEVIRLGGDKIPVFGQQLRGCYIRDSHVQKPNFAVPGWYSVIGFTRFNGVVLCDCHGTQFITSANDIKAVLPVNLECVERGVSL